MKGVEDGGGGGRPFYRLSKLDKPHMKRMGRTAALD